jgi:hypothetical protein
MQFLALLETIASNLSATNIESFITLTENLITLGESVFKHQAASVAPVASTTPAPTTTTVA